MFIYLHLGLLILVICTVSQSAAEDCSKIMDLCFLVDSSASICNSDPTSNKKTDKTSADWKAILGFMHNIANDLNIGVDATRVATVLFSSNGNRRWNLTRGTDKESLLDAIDGLQCTGGKTNISEGLDVMMNLVFQFSFGDRLDADNVVIVITDARGTDHSAVQPAIDRVHTAGVKTFAVGVTNTVDEDSLKQLASDPKQINRNYFTDIDFNILPQILSTVQSQICVESDPYPTPFV